MAGFGNAFIQSYQPAAERAVQQMRFDEQQELRERAQKMEEKVQNKRLKQLSQEIQRYGKMTPIKVDTAEAQRRGATAQADLSESKADNYDRRFSKEMEQLNQQIDTAKARARQANTSAATQELQNRIKRLQLRQAKRIREQRGQIQNVARQTQPRQAQPKPNSQPESWGRTADKAWNATLGKEAQMLGGMLRSIGLESAGNWVEETGTATTPDTPKGNQWVDSVAVYGRQMRRRFENANPQARDTRVAQNTYNKLTRAYQALSNRAYGMEPKKRKERMRQLEQDIKYFRSVMPQKDPARQELLEVGRKAASEESFGPAVDAYEQYMSGPQRDGQGGSNGNASMGGGGY